MCEASICLIGANGTGTEVLKNLILPGVGHVTIIDSKTVDAEDLKTNFFLTPDSIGYPRHSEALKYLLELNPDVNGISHDGTIDYINKDTVLTFTLIITTDLNDF